MLKDYGISVSPDGKTLIIKIPLQRLYEFVSPTTKDGQLNIQEFTQREKQIFPLVRQGLSNKEIAGVIHVSERTVKFHVSHILEKLSTTRASILRNYGIKAEGQTIRIN